MCMEFLRDGSTPDKIHRPGNERKYFAYVTRAFRVRPKARLA